MVASVTRYPLKIKKTCHNDASFTSLESPYSMIGFPQDRMDLTVHSPMIEIPLTCLSQCFIKHCTSMEQDRSLIKDRMVLCFFLALGPMGRQVYLKTRIMKKSFLYVGIGQEAHFDEQKADIFVARKQFQHFMITTLLSYFFPGKCNSIQRHSR